MDLKDYPRKKYTINQFTQPPCYELEGESFFFVMDDGYDYELRIICKDFCEWNIEGEPPKKETYKCLKGDDTTYLLYHEVDGAEFRTCLTYIIDLQQRLVTILTCKTGLNPKYPLIVTSHFDFGAIRVEGEELAFKRHSFTDDMLDTCVQWCWGVGFYTRHAYNSTTFYRITVPGESIASVELAEPMRLPTSDEWARYIKIKENMYLFDLTEIYSERIMGDKRKWRSNNMAFLQNYDRMYHVGRFFGNGMIDDKVVPSLGMFGAFGSPFEFEPEFLNEPNPYIV